MTPEFNRITSNTSSVAHHQTLESRQRQLAFHIQSYNECDNFPDSNLTKNIKMKCLTQAVIDLADLGILDRLLSCITGSDKASVKQNIILADALAQLEKPRAEERDLLLHTLKSVIGGTPLNTFRRARFLEVEKKFEFGTNHADTKFQFSTTLLYRLKAESYPADNGFAHKLQTLEDKIFETDVWPQLTNTSTDINQLAQLIKDADLDAFDHLILKLTDGTTSTVSNEKLTELFNCKKDGLEEALTNASRELNQRFIHRNLALIGFV